MENIIKTFFSECVLMCLFSLFCALAVTLLDSMSALADLGWEAYPNEGVSICTHTHKNHLLFMLDLALKV